MPVSRCIIYITPECAVNPALTICALAERAMGFIPPAA